MALSLLCGGLGVASASLEVVDQSGTAGTVTIYTKDEVDNALLAKGAATDVAANKTDIETLKTAVGNAGSGLTKDVADQKADIATNRANINNLDGKLANLTTTVSGKADEAAVTTALGDKANTDLSNLTADGVNKIKNTMSADMDLKADKTYVDNALANKADTGTVTTLEGRVGGVEGRVTTLETKVGDASGGLVKDVADLKAQGTTLNTELGNKANQSDLVDATNRITANEGKITDLQKKTAKLSDDGKELTGMTTVSGTTVSGTNVEANALKVTGEISNGAGVTTTLAAINDSMTQTATNKGDIAALQSKTGEQQTAINGLDAKTKQISYDPAKGTTVNGVDFKDTEVYANNKGLAGVSTLNTTGAATIGGALKADSLIVENASNLKGDVTMDKKLSVTGDTSLKKTDVDGALNVTGESSLKNTKVDGTLTTTGKATFQEAVEMDKGLTVTSGDTTLKGTKVDGKLTVTDDAELKNTTVDGTLIVNKETTLNDKLIAKGEATFEKKVTMEDNLEVKGTLNTKDVTAETIHISKSEDKPDYKSEGSIIGEGGKLSVSNEKFDKINNITEKSELNVNEKGTVNWATSTDNATGNVTEGRSEVTADNIKNSVKKTEGGTTFGYEENITADGKVGTVTDKDGNRNELTQTATGTENTVTSKDGNKSTTKQEAGSISSTVYDKDGNVKASSEMKEDGSISNNATGDMTNTVGGKLTTTVTGATEENYNGGLTTKVTGEEKHTVTGKQTNTVEGGQENIISGGQTNTITGGQINNITGDQTTTITGNKTETVEGQVTENFKGGQKTNVTGNQDIHVTGKQTNKIDGDQENTIGGNQTTTVTGDISNKAKNITNEASNSITDKVGDHTRVLDSDGITDTVGGSTFKQRIDKIMMESKDVSIKAEETLTNEAKVITNKASEVINNEAININNTATGIITSKASEIKNQADKLISNKVGENTSEYMEDGKITTSVKDGAKSTVTIQNADGLQAAVTNGTSTNASATTATSSTQTIASGSKANSVITTIDGTQFVNSDAWAPVTGASGAGTAVNTKIKGNTITTGKVTMDYADVMKDLGVHGNATVDKDMTVKGNTTLGEAGKDTTLIVNSKATFNENAIFENGAEVKNGLTVSSGGLNVTGESTFNDKVTMNNGLDVTGGVASDSFTVKGTDIKIDSSGINAGGTVISNVADGSISEGSKDAVNGGQLYQVKNDLEGKVNKVGANAAAMANLHPMEFDPDSKWNIAAAMGNYGSETATAIGAFYRPNEDVMVNFSTAFGTGENMVGGGVSVRLGKGGNKLSREENNALKAQVDDLTARMDALLSVLNPNMSKDFPDVPENHWAYEAVSRLAGNDIVQGYPDGEFHGERTMTRYEMAEIIYNALSRGAEAERELVEEFKPELQAMAASEKATAERAEG